MSTHDEGSGNEAATSSISFQQFPVTPNSTETKLQRLAGLELQVKELREEIRAEYDLMRALFGRQRKAKPLAQPAKRGRPRKAKAETAAE